MNEPQPNAMRPIHPGEKSPPGYDLDSVLGIVTTLWKLLLQY